MNPRAIIFDLDGTLIDSAPGLHLAAADMLAERGLPQPDLPTIIGFIGRGAPTLVARCLDWAGADPAGTDDALDRFLAIYGSDPMRGTKVYPGTHDLLADLRAAGLKLGLCTNKPEAPARAILDAFDLGPFDAVAGGDTLAKRKPDPAPLLHVADLLDTAPGAVLYVGDSEIDWLTAQAAGISYAHVAGGYQTHPIADFAPRLHLPDLTHLKDALASL